MKVTWWNGGLHIEPESQVEAEAMMLLLRSIKNEIPPEDDAPKRPDATQAGESDGG